MDFGSLTLTRRVGEKIVIGDGPNAVIVEVADRPSGGEVKLRIRAPKSVPVWREELTERPS